MPVCSPNRGSALIGEIYKLLSEFTDVDIEQALKNMKVRLGRDMESQEIRDMFVQLGKTVVDLKKLKAFKEATE